MNFLIRHIFRVYRYILSILRSIIKTFISGPKEYELSVYDGRKNLYEFWFTCNDETYHRIIHKDTTNVVIEKQKDVEEITLLPFLYFHTVKYGSNYINRIKKYAGPRGDFYCDPKLKWLDVLPFLNEDTMIECMTYSCTVVQFSICEKIQETLAKLGS